MTTGQITTSAALFCGAEDGQRVPLRWYEKALDLFRQHQLEPILFTASGGGFEYDDCYVLADAGHDLLKWGEVLPARRHDLVVALQNGVVDSLGLDSPRIGLCRPVRLAC